MLPIAWYLLKVIICSGILFGYYWLLLRNKIFHQYNRFYLLAAVVLSLTLPLIQISFWQQQQQSPVVKALQVVSFGDEYMNEVIVKTNPHHWSVQEFFPIIYWLVSGFFIVLLFRTLIAIRTLLKKYPVQELENISLVNTDDKNTPFSFLNYIFWNNDIDPGTTTGKQIFKHELVHVQEKHTYDKLFINIVLLFGWCNPFFWLIRKELNMIHEFIADKKAVEDSDTAAFAAMILQSTYPQHRFQLTNNFFYSPIKRRLLMLTKNKNPRVNYFARIMVLPLAVLVFAAFTLKTKTNDVGKFAAMNNAAPSNITDTVPRKLPSVVQWNAAADKTANEKIDPKKALYIYNGKIIGKGKAADEATKYIYASTVYVKWLKKAEAIAKYGKQGEDGACEITTVNEKQFLSSDLVPTQFQTVPDFELNQKIAHDTLNLKLLERQVQGMKLKSTDTLLLTLKQDLNTLGNLKVTTDDAQLLKLKQDLNTQEKLVQGMKLKSTDAQLLKLKQDLNTQENIKLSDEPKAFWGNFRGGHVNLEAFKAQKEIRVSTGYSFVSATVYFQGPGFDNAVVSVYLSSTSISSIENPVNRCQVGSTIVFDNVKVKDNAGNIKTVSMPPAFLLTGNKIENDLQSNDKVFLQVETPPSFTGGKEAWMKFLQANLKAFVPVDNGAKAGIYKVVLKFIVKTDGSISDITCENDPGYGTCAEAIRFIKATPKWQPAVQNGQKVNAYLKQPITFVVEEQ